MVSSVLDQAQNFAGGPVAAARQRDRWARREANATAPAERGALREAIFDLEERYPDLRNIPVGGAEAFARERGHGRGSRSPVHDGRRRPQPSSGGAKPRANPSPAAKPKPHPTRPPAAKRARTGGRPTPRVDRAIRQTGIPGAAGSAGSMVMAALGGTAGLGLLYLTLSSAETPGTGAAAFPRLVHGIVRFVGRLIEPVDIFPEGPTAAETFHVKTPHGVVQAKFRGPATVKAAAARLKEAEKQGNHR